MGGCSCVATIIGLMLIIGGFSSIIEGGSIIIPSMLIIIGFLIFTSFAVASVKENFDEAVDAIISFWFGTDMTHKIAWVGITIGLVLIICNAFLILYGLRETGIEGRTIIIYSILIIIGFLIFIPSATAAMGDFSEGVGISMQFLLILSPIPGGLLACYEFFQYLKDGDRSVYSALEGIEWILETPVTWIGLREILLKFPFWLFLLLVFPVCLIVIIGIALGIISIIRKNRVGNR